MKQRSNVLGWGVFFVLALFIFQCGGGDGGGDAQGDPPGGGGDGGGDAQGDPPDKPQGLTAAASSGEITLTWTALPDITYNLFHSTTPGIDVDAANVTKIQNAESPYTHTGLTNGTTYYYRLTAVNASGASEPSDEVSATPPAQITISAGSAHTCAMVNGAARCWGNGGDGRIGDGMAMQRNAPVEVDDDLYD